jgi:hypothetical protein
MSGMGRQYKTKLFSGFWIRKPILDILKMSKTQKRFKKWKKTFIFSLSYHNGHNFNTK